VTRTCQPRLGHFLEMARDGGVAGLLPRRRGTGKGGEMESATDFDGDDGALVIVNDSSDVLQQGEATRKVRGDLNRSERLRSQNSPSRGGDGGGGSKFGGPPVA
jgi:hypothetical protein